MVEQAIKSISEYLEAELKEELRQQGHVATGNLLKSIEVSGVLFGDGAVISVYYEDYGNPVDTGVSAQRIPFGGSRGGTSKYIQGLMQWVSVIKGYPVGSRQNKAMTFAVAHTHKKEGMPSRGSFRFSKNGRRTGWAERTVERSRARIAEILIEDTGRAIDMALDVVIERVQRRIAA